ncbi:hypothetical protein FBY39_2448 [Microbacterium sp. SLBN-146]|nr:hypothetical protein FBY39_2448 [Microbacterium sp. SLBN-146]
MEPGTPPPLPEALTDAIAVLRDLGPRLPENRRLESIRTHLHAVDESWSGVVNCSSKIEELDETAARHEQIAATVTSDKVRELHGRQATDDRVLKSRLEKLLRTHRERFSSEMPAFRAETEDYVSWLDAHDRRGKEPSLEA